MPDCGLVLALSRCRSGHKLCVSLVCVVTATDLDSVTNSQLTYSVSDNSFTVQTLNNIGYIKTAK